MTQQDDITQRVLPAEQEAVRRALEAYAESYDMMARVAKREGRDASVGVHAVAYDIRRNMVNAVLRALSKLRAPVAGEAQQCVACEGRPSGDNIPCALCGMDAAPQASAGEAQPVAWRYQTPTGWHATTDAQKAVSLRAHHPVEPLYPKPQASAEAPKLPAGWQLALNLAIDAIENAGPMDWPVNWPAILHGLKELRAALSQPQADKDSGQQREGVVTDDMRYAVRFAPSSAHWSERLVEFFGPDAREGIDALERQLREARAMLDRQQRAGDAERWRWATATDENAQMLYTIVQAYGGDQQKINERADFYRAALSAPLAEQGERDA